MDKKNRINQILLNLADAAAAAADDVTDAVQNAGHAVGEKYDEIKLKIELARLKDEQNKLFCDIGRTAYLIQSGDIVVDEQAADSEALDVQQTIERLLLLADQKQQELDAVSERLHKMGGLRACPVCAEVTGEGTTFCPGCGARLQH